MCNWYLIIYYIEIEITIQGLISAALKLSVESVVESIVSWYERHFNKSRQQQSKSILCTRWKFQE